MTSTSWPRARPRSSPLSLSGCAGARHAASEKRGVAGMWRRGIVPLTLSLVAGVLVGLTWSATTAGPAAADQPAGFTEQVVFSGLNHPTKLVFAPDGRI